jgi:hypothetical protein
LQRHWLSDTRRDSAGHVSHDSAPSGTTSSGLHTRQVLFVTTRPKPSAQAHSILAMSNVSPGSHACTDTFCVRLPVLMSLPNRSGPVSVNSSS